MLKQLLQLILENLNERERKGSTIDSKIVEIVEEINELEEEYVEALAEAERWGDLNDKSHWRTVEVNRLKRMIQAKEKMIDTLKNNN